MRIHRQNVVQQVWARIHHGFDRAKIARAAALHHIAGDGIRTAGKTDQRYAAIERFANLRHCVKDILQFRHVRYFEALYGDFILQWTVEFRPLIFHEAQTQPHRVRYGQNVGEQNRRVQVVAVNGLKRDLGGQLRILRQLHEAAGLRARGAVFRQIASRLTHQPNRRVFGGLAAQCAQKRIVLKGSKCGHEANFLKIGCQTCAHGYNTHGNQVKVTLYQCIDMKFKIYGLDVRRSRLTHGWAWHGARKCPNFEYNAR